MDTQPLIDAIERRARETGLAPSTICLRAVRNARLYDHLKAGGSCTIRIASKLLAALEAAE